MKTIETKTCLTLIGNISADSNNWWEFYQYSKQLINKLGFNANNVGVIGQSFKSGKILNLGKAEPKIKKAVNNTEKFSSLEVLALQENYKQAAFDYDVSSLMYMDLKPYHITISVRGKERLEKVGVDEIISTLKGFLEFSSGQLYELATSEDSIIYTLKGKSVDKFKGLKVIKEF
jgi:hypothetical protein